MAQVKIGTVISDKMQNTVVVNVVEKRRHPFYKKLITRHRKFKAHNSTGAKTGDKVKIIESRPMSRGTHFVVSEVIK